MRRPGKMPAVTRRSALALATLALAGCTAPAAPKDADRDDVADAPAESEPSADEPTEPESEDEPETPADSLEAEVEAALAALTLEQRVAQLFVVRPEAITGVGRVTAAGETTRAALAAHPVGGLVYFAANLIDSDQTRSMLASTQSYAQEACGLPIFLCVDEEGGTVSRVGGNSGFGVDNVGNMCDVGATGDADYAYQVAEHIGTYLDYLGFNVDFAPDADVASNPQGTMGLRAFGTTADAVSPMVEAQVRGFADAGMLCAAKHFPGIGGAVGDSHDARIYSQDDRATLLAAGGPLDPFRAAIAEDVPMIMVGHLSLPNVTGDDDPASVSAEVVTDILRGELGYDGIAITDSMGMGAATSSLPNDRLAVEALLAGIDMVLMPADFQAAYQGVLDAVASGELTEERIDESVRRVLRVKLGRLA